MQQAPMARRWLRRFVHSVDGGACEANPLKIHNTSVHLDDWRCGYEMEIAVNDMWPHDDARWPKNCVCGYEFKDRDEWQLDQEWLYRRDGTDLLYTLREAPPGAMWYGDWMLTEGSNLFRGPDGHCLIVKCPNGNQWTIDGVASNCTMRGDYEHKCWVRHGTPPLITVDKNGRTCDAGGGSIKSGDYHGFLRNGEFT
jgi:hypothetical protein